MNRAARADRLAAVVVIIVAVAAAAIAGRFPRPAGAVPGPSTFPLLMAGLCLVLGVALLLRPAAAAEPVEPGTARRRWGLVALTIGYVLLMPWAGFISASALFLIAAIRALGYPHGWRAGAVALATAFLVYWVFAVVMKVPLPAGWLG